MRSLRQRMVGVAVAVAVVAVGALLSACTPGPDGPEAPVSTTPSGDAEVIEPLDEIDGATRTEVAGVSIAVPDGWAGEPVDLDNGVTQLALTPSGAERAEAYLTVSEVGDVSDGDVEAGSYLSETRLAGSLVDLTRTRGTWEGFGPVVVVRGTLVLEAGNRDIVLVTTRDVQGTRLVSIAAEAPEGELAQSTGFEVLRTVRVGT